MSTVAAWGDNSSGQTNVPAGLIDVTAIAGGYFHSLALKSDGTVAAWGGDRNGQTDVPAGLTDVSAIACGARHNLALKSDGTVVAWGDNTVGQTEVPAGLTNVIGIAAGESHSLALKGDGTVVAWGDNRFVWTSVPAGLTNVTAIACGRFHNLALKSNGTVVAWGDNSFGQIDVPSGLNGVIAVAVGATHSLAITGTVAAPPAVLNPGNQETAEDTSTGEIAVQVSDADTSLAALTLSAVSSVPGLVQQFLYGGSGANRTLEIIPAANQNGSATITLTVSDGTNDTTADFTLIVLPVNDVPSFVKGADQSIAENAGSQTVPAWATSLSPGPTADEFTQNLAFQVINNSNPGLFSAGPAVNGTTGALTFTPAANTRGTATLTLQLMDDGGTDNGGVDTSASQTFTITVNAGYAVSGPATVASGASLTVQWTAPSGHSSTDWIALFDSGVPGPTGYAGWAYTSSAISGSFNLTAPAPGTYQLRFYQNDGSTVAAVSSTITVTGTVASDFTLTAPATVAAGASLTVTWDAPASRSGTDWIGFYIQGTPGPSGYLAWTYTAGKASGTFTITAPTRGGPFVFRYYRMDSGTLAATSDPISLTGVNNSPTVTLDNPGGPSAAPASLTLAATATDDGSIAKVEFYENGSKLGESTTPNGMTGKYEYAWTGVTAGTYSVTAKAYDNTGLVTTSSAYSVTVTGTPSISVTLSPASVAPGGSYTLSWSAPPGRPSTDWIAVYTSSTPGPTGYLTWFYTGGARTGSRTLTAPSFSGDLVARYYLQDSSTLGAISNTLTVTGSVPASFTVTSNVTSVASGGTLTVSWTAPVGRPTQDWVALVRTDQYTAGPPDVITGYVKWAYTGGTTSGNTTFNLTGVAAGTYYCVYLLNDSTTVGAQSAVVTVTP